jgi:uncharacterized protein
MDGVAVSFSGGVDSTVLLSAVTETLPDDHVAVFVDVPMLSERQRDIAVKVAKELNASMVTVKLGHDDMPHVKENTAERCYHCKRSIYSVVSRIASERGYKICVDGENFSDRDGERPGRKAAAEFNIVSPLKELKLEREDVERMFLSLRIRTDVQKETCLATRIPAGVPFDDIDLRHIEECENAIRNISGVRQIRMRLRDGHAELFTSPGTIRLLFENEKELSCALKEKGIRSVTINTEGYNG